MKPKIGTGIHWGGGGAAGGAESKYFSFSTKIINYDVIWFKTSLLQIVKVEPLQLGISFTDQAQVLHKVVKDHFCTNTPSVII